MSYTNADGLYVLTGLDEGAELKQGVSAQSSRRTLVIDIVGTEVPSAFGASNIKPNHPTIPAGAIIVNADLVISTAFDSAADTATLTIGTYTAAGAAIVAAGIDSAIAQTAIDAQYDVVQCDGTQVSALLALSNTAYIGWIYGTEAFTAGAAKLVIEYIVL